MSQKGEIAYLFDQVKTPPIEVFERFVNQKIPYTTAQLAEEVNIPHI